MTNRPDLPSAAHSDVVIVGAGFAAIAVFRALARAGVHDVTVLEQAGEIGGTWRDNTYPGCRCDVESLLYSFSFAPNPDWTELYASQAEILAYLGRVAADVGMSERVVLSCRVEFAAWDDHARLWRLRTSTGERTCRVLVQATGPFNEPNWLHLPGRDSYAGRLVHTARWPDDVDLTGRRVVVVGTGASAVQVVPAIQPVVDHLTVVMRTPPWVTPHRNEPIDDEQHRHWRQHPEALARRRRLTYRLHEVIGYAFGRRPALVRWGERAALAHLAEQVPDPELRRLLTPSYRMGCKRVTPSNNFYPAFMAPNTSLVPHAATYFTATGVGTADGEHHDADVVVLATGFRMAPPESLRAVVGRHGRSLHDTYAGHPHGYLGTTVSGFPNLFTVPGPGTGQGHTSVLLYYEAQAQYVASALSWMRQRGIQAVDVDKAVQQEYDEDLQRRVRSSVWATGGCDSWYLDATGRVSLVWPGSTGEFVRRTARFDPNLYHLTPA